MSKILSGHYSHRSQSQACRCHPVGWCATAAAHERSASKWSLVVPGQPGAGAQHILDRLIVLQVRVTRSSRREYHCRMGTSMG